MNPAKRLKFFAGVLAGVLTAGALGFTFLEGLGLGDSLYLTIVTVATVGYGDIVPVTAGGRVLAVVLMVTGVSTFLGLVAGGTEFLMERRQEELRKERLSMAIEIFLTEIGCRLLRSFSSADPRLPECLSVGPEWTPRDFQRAVECFDKHVFAVKEDLVDLPEIRDFLDSKLPTLLRILENPNLAEHELFTDMLRAIFHLKAELSARESLSNLPQADFAHLLGDVNRTYSSLARVWLGHMQYLKKSYPYLFSFSARTNPFNKNASPTVEK